jgi:hypothetical protein
MKIGFLPQTEEIHSTGSGCLNQAGQVTVSSSDTGPRLGIESDELLLAKVLQRPFQILCGSDEAHFAPVLAYGKVRDFLPGYCAHSNWPGSRFGNSHRKTSLAQWRVIGRTDKHRDEQGWNPRRRAWETGSRLKTKEHRVHGVDTGLRNAWIVNILGF